LDLIQIPVATLGALHRALHDEVGGDSAARILRQIGLDSGEALYARFGDWLSGQNSDGALPETLGPDDFWGRVSDFFEYLGWGRLESREIHPGVLALTFSGWAEAREGSGDPAGCHFTTGVIADLLRRVAGGDLAALEVECDSSNGGTSRILIGNTTALDAVFASMVEGVRYEDAVAALV